MSDAAVKISRNPLTLSLPEELIVTEWTERLPRQEVIDTGGEETPLGRISIARFARLLNRSRRSISDDLRDLECVCSVGRKCYVIVDGHFRADDAVAALHPREEGCATGLTAPRAKSMDRRSSARGPRRYGFMALIISTLAFFPPRLFRRPREARLKRRTRRS